MSWSPVDAPDLTRDLIVFDGDCVLCSHSARSVHKRDTAGRFAFVAIQSLYGRALAARFGVDPDDPETNLVAAGGRVWFKSDAVLAVLRALPGWAWIDVARLVPRGVRDWAYDRVARNRFRWFGRRERCWAEDPSLSARIIERADGAA
jgi:predicted DCC family thiol-disulfide oxidoreductase YuxK